MKWGVAICKDMDFSDIGIFYGHKNVPLVLVPALDFKVDDWQHGRVAMMRGIENGFAVARASGQGLLSLTNQYGEIIELKKDYEKMENILINKVNLQPMQTFYNRFGPWFGWLSVIFSFFIILYSLIIKQN